MVTERVSWTATIAVSIFSDSCSVNLKPYYLNEVTLMYDDISTDDVHVALMFMDSLPENEPLIMVCKNIKSIPYIKRAIMKELGVPDTNLFNLLKYGSRRIQVLPEYSVRESAPPNSILFYVPLRDKSDWYELGATHGYKQCLVPYLMYEGIDANDVLTWLLRDGLPLSAAVNRMVRDGILPPLPVS